MYFINLDDKNSKRAKWVLLFIDRNIAICFHSFGIGHIPQEVLSSVLQINMVEEASLEFRLR